MNVETNEMVWLTTKEIEKAIRAYVIAKGFKVLTYAAVSGLGLSEADYPVSVQIARLVQEVKK